MKYIIMLGILFGLTSHLLFFLGISGLLSVPIVSIIGITLVGTVAFFTVIFLRVYSKASYSQIEASLIVVIVLLSFINFIGVLGPEIAFDALWYHLTLPKLFLFNKQISFIPGGLLYYSTMPKTVDMLYMIGIAFGSEVFAKGIHYFFGLCSLFLVYAIGRLYLNRFFSLLSVIVFLTNLVFSWESITAYSDLTWSFYELLAFYCFVLFVAKRKVIWLIMTSVWIGFAITTKLVALQSIVLYGTLLLFLGFFHLLSKKRIAVGLCILFLSLLVPLPWFIWTYVVTGNPVYPFFTGRFDSYSMQFLNTSFSAMFFKWKTLFLYPNDPISPLYMMFFPLLVFVYKKLNKQEVILYMYVLISVIILMFLPLSGGTRFLLPYLGVWSVAIGVLLFKLSKKKHYRYIYSIAVTAIFVVVCIVGVYRGLANIKYIPYVLGFESKRSFLSNNLSFESGDFYDIDGYFKREITQDDTVLLIGFHNLFYVDFPYVHQSWYQGEPITHVATQNTTLPEEYSEWKLDYTNTQTNVKVYKKPEI